MDAFNEGKHGYWEGLEILENPYIEFQQQDLDSYSEDALAWRRGYLEAMEEMGDDGTEDDPDDDLEEEEEPDEPYYDPTAGTIGWSQDPDNETEIN